MMAGPGTCQPRDDHWPIDENVLLSLSENVRPTVTERYRADLRENAAAVATAVRACLAERVEPTRKAVLALQYCGRPRRQWWRRRPSKRDSRDEAALLASQRTQTRLMAVRSKYPADRKYYASDAPHMSRTVEELCQWMTAAEAATLDNFLTYTAGTVLHDSDTGACHLRGLTDPRCLVAVDCTRLATLPRHQSTVKMYSELCVLKATDGHDALVLVPHHFQVFSVVAAIL